MATAIKMPQLGVTMTEAKVVRWLKVIGDSIQVDEPVAEIETDKLSAEVHATGAGVLRAIVAAEGATVAVAGLLGVIAAPGEPESAVAALSGGVRSVGDEEMRAHPSRSPHPLISSSPVSPRATPLAKRLASEAGLDLAAIAGSGPQGRITEADVRAAASRPAPVPSSPHPLIPSSPSFVRASPLARRLAREGGMDLRSIAGSGPDGRVLERDIVVFASSPRRTPSPLPRGEAGAAAPGEGAPRPRRETIPVTGVRRVIAERMWQSLQRTAQLTLTTEADASALVELRGHLLPAARVYGHRPPTYTDLLVQIVARVLPQHPLLNSSLLGEGDTQEIACWSEVNIGVAVALERGLVVPVVRQADAKSLDAISAALGDLVERARANTLTVDDLTGGTFTITNLGAQEIDGFTPIINPPQCAILGVGRIARKPAVVGDQVVPRHLLTLSLTFDHRIVDGAPAAAFLRDVKRAIEGVASAG